MFISKGLRQEVEPILKAIELLVTFIVLRLIVIFTPSTLCIKISEV